MRKPVIVVALVAALGGIWWCTRPAEALEFVTWGKAVERSKKENKPILLIFGGPW